MSNSYLDWAAQISSSTASIPRSIGSSAPIAASGCARRRSMRDHPVRDMFDLIFLDPPTFSNSKRMQGVLDVQRDHPELIGLLHAAAGARRAAAVLDQCAAFSAGSGDRGSAGRSWTSRRRRCRSISRAIRASTAASRSARRRPRATDRARASTTARWLIARGSLRVFFGLLTPRGILLHGILGLLLRAVLDLLGLARLLGFRGCAGRGAGRGTGQAAAGNAQAQATDNRMCFTPLA